MLADLGLNVARSIPADLLPGLMSGAYTSHGGVVRDLTGQIIAHLALPSSSMVSSTANLVPGVGVASGLLGNIQLTSISQDVHQALNFAMTSTVLSGLNLATSIVGFTYLAARIAQVDQKLNALAKQAKEIKQILQSQQRSRLLAAVDNYRLSSKAEDAETRRQLLLQAQSLFGELAHHYKSQLKEHSALVEIEASEGYFVAACLGNAICTSDLGMGDAAGERLRHHYSDWTGLARQHCGKLLQLNDPVRLLDARYVEDLPAAMLVSLLDFAHRTNRGIGWIDDLRRALGKGTMLASAVRGIDKPVIEFAKGLRARDDVMQSYVAHFSFLADKKISATEFSAAIENMREREGAALLWVSQAVPR
jgi:hypothetical protein